MGESDDNTPTLFLDGSLINSAIGYMHNNATQVVCLLIGYCEQIQANICFVSGKEDIDETMIMNKRIKEGFKVPDTNIENVMVTKQQSIPVEVQNCDLPAMISKNKKYVISGLCNVLRYIVKYAINNRDRNFMNLLGYKKCCLKATFEVSSKTNLCEVVAPYVIDTWIPSRVKYDSSKYCDPEIPNAVKEFERLMGQPVVIHNKDKRQRVVLKHLMESDSKQCDDGMEAPSEKYIKYGQGNFKRKPVVRTNDLPPLEHVFVEGVELMLSDIALLPILHAFLVFSLSSLEKLKSIIPLTLLWYHRIQNISKMQEAAKACNLKFCDVSHIIGFQNFKLIEGKCENREILQLGSEKTCKDLSKKDLEKTIRRDLPPLLDKVDELLFVSFKKFDVEKISLQWEQLPESVHPTKGELTSLRALRKCQQIENLLFAVRSISQDEDVIVDFCCGGGHVGIVIAYMMPKCKIILVDNKEESLDRARSRIEMLGLSNITVYQCNLQNYRGEYNVGVALHACGVATDMVVKQCVQANASFVVSPCCYGRIQNTQFISYPQSTKFRELSISCEELVLLGHGGDQTSWNFEGEKSKTGKTCMGLVDMDRIHAAEERGYEASLYSLLPHTCSPKNNLIIGVAPTTPK